MSIASSASSRSRQHAEVSQPTSTMGPPGRREPQSSHRPAPGLSSRTPKRIKATPPSRPLGACTSTVANNSSGESRLVNGEASTRFVGNSHKLPLNSPWRSPAWSSERDPRRKRENTVPMVIFGRIFDPLLMLYSFLRLFRISRYLKPLRRCSKALDGQNRGAVML